VRLSHRRRLASLPQARAYLCVAVCLAALLLACGGDDGPPTSDIVSTIPWRADESLTYRLENEDGEVVGSAVLSIDLLDGTTELRQRFVAGPNTDETLVVVEARGLKPQSARREVRTQDDDEVIDVTYTAEGALIKQGERQSGLKVPEHAYDNDSSLFLWRTIPFADGYEASYVTVITNRRSRDTVTLRVTGRERVTVPAGSFDAWRLEVRSSNARQHAWYADTPTRPLLRYDNDRGTIFVLETMP
jgi:hypothetical protein